MADTTTPNPSVDTSKVEAENDTDTHAPSRTSPDKGNGVVKPEVASHVEAASPVSLSPGHALSPLRGSPANGLPATHPHVAAPGAPQQKKFTHSNINKKFLEKTHSTSTPSQTLSASVAAKSGTSTPKPPLQTAPFHSRLVTAKLTATSQSSTTGSGWSRPPSSVSSATPTPPSATNTKAPPPSSSTNNSGSAPQPPAAGKVIQPQPRGATDIFVTSVKKDSAGKPAWGSAKNATAIVTKLDAVAGEFPTAAEVAQGHASKIFEKKEAVQAAVVQAQAMTAQADTFRGVHLDPNAHHWDEMEEDDDNFLDGVIDFGDGRQYKVEATEASQQPSPSGDAPGFDEREDSKPVIEGVSLLDQPVSKEERFADDFDRSWPRTKLTTNFSNSQREHYSNGAPSSASSQSVHSPSESKVLFNERSNRLEPYSYAHPPHRQSNAGQISYSGRRGSRSDHVASEPRGGRDVPPHVHPQGVQLLQKAPGNIERRHDGLRFPGDPAGHFDVPLSRHPERESHRHDSQQSAAFTRTPSHHGHQGRAHDHRGPYDMPPHAARHDERPVRLSTMPPPPLPLHSARNSPNELSRQLPPHLPETRSPKHGPRTSLLPDAHQETANLTAEPPPDISRSSAVPVQAPAIEPSPVVPTDPIAPTSAGPAVDLNEVHKKEMQSAAERARQRRQQEEEEREREKERARKKAVELEARLKAKEAQERPEASTAVSETQVVGVIEDAIRGAIPSESALDLTTQGSDLPSASKPVFGRSASSKGTVRPDQGPRMSSTAMAVPESPSSAMEADSWRCRAPPRMTTHVDPGTEISAPPPPPLPLLAEVESFHLTGGDDVEVVDFSDMGKFVGVEGTAEPTRSDRFLARPPRASAIDFFEDDVSVPEASLHVPQSDDSSWRRRNLIYGPSMHAPEGSGTAAATRETLRVQIVPSETPRSPGSSPAVHSRISPPQHRHVDDRPYSGAIHTHSGHHGHGPQRSPLTPSYREAPMSALNDVISRIKGALDDMHTKEESPKQPKWLPPALRPKQAGHDFAQPTEVFDVTGKEPPRSPRPAWNVFTVKLPKGTLPQLPPIRSKQLQGFRSVTSVWSAIYSWVPPIGGNNRRDVAVEEYLFGGSPTSREAHTRYRVALPKRQSPVIPLAKRGDPGPVVNLPSKLSGNRGTKSDVREAETASWRKSPPAPAQQLQDATHVRPGLDTTSRSPPPEAPFGNTASLPKNEPTSPGGPAAPQAKPHPSLHKLPASVSFVVNSEIDESHSAESTTSRRTGAQLDVQPVSGIADVISGRGGSSKPLAVSVVSASSDGGNKHASDPPGPSSSTVTWSKSPRAFPLKDSPSRGGPDPEHLKAVWSQASDKASLPSVNSLEGIADDLTAVPFTLQDVKSEDGGTPPPSGSGASRMSSYDVTRAFQQVPVSSMKSPQRNTILPPAVSSAPTPNGQASRPAFPYTPTLRPAYPYPSPVPSHSPSPTVVYPPQVAPSPIPRPMVLNGPPSPYGQPMWVPMGGPPQAQAHMMRPMPSSYTPQYVPYPSPGPVYLPTAQQPPNGAQARGPGVPMMSPMVQPAHALYSSSPVLIHSPQIQPPHGYGNTPASRGHVRGNFEHASSGSNAPAQAGHPPQQPPYAAATTFSARPTW
ncbi:hypothetical protein DAEQUDRAFT_720036 [Daedalea quercina L-15889]|uniref:Uncharacterized protein n=1 Tax=Daedalea quercina L-15889 TaxID=1314783 RepID=A0A165UG02_9APHY|nr:hypothetical protein DAEQUDRAFT_720036 [Daedalea quercina L-15889]